MLQLLASATYTIYIYMWSCAHIRRIQGGMWQLHVDGKTAFIVTLPLSDVSSTSPTSLFYYCYCHVLFLATNFTQLFSFSSILPLIIMSISIPQSGIHLHSICDLSYSQLQRIWSPTLQWHTWLAFQLCIS